MLRNLSIFILCLGMAFFAGKHQERMEIQEQVVRIETQMQNVATEADEKLKQEKKNAQAKIDALKSSVADGSVRMYVRASCNSSTPNGDTENGAELDRQTAQDLIGITADGDKAILQLNACIDLYNDLRNIKWISQNTSH